MVTAISSKKYPVPSDPGSQTAMSKVSTAVGDHAGIPCAVTFPFFFSFLNKHGFY